MPEKPKRKEYDRYVGECRGPPDFYDEECDRNDKIVVTRPYNADSRLRISAYCSVCGTTNVLEKVTSSNQNAIQDEDED